MNGILSGRRQRNGKIEFLRFMFCVIIMMMHSSTFVSEGTKNFFKSRGGLGVEFFFLVSGYLLAVSVAKAPALQEGALGKETQRFLGRKIKAVMPNFLVAWGIGYLVTMVTYKDFSPMAWIKKIADTLWELLFLEMAGFGRVRVNGVDWYISAMLLAMLFLYPLCRKYFSTTIRVTAPLIGIAILGYLFYNCKTTLGVTTYMNIAYRGTLRAIGMICIGISCYPLIEWLKKQTLTKFGKILITFVEAGIYGTVVGYMALADSKTYDFVVILLITAGVVLSFSHQGLLADKFDNRVCLFLGKFSLSIYLGHVYWGRLLNKWYPDGEYLELFKVYVLLAIFTAIVIYGISEMLRSKADIMGLHCRRFLIKQEEVK